MLLSLTFFVSSLLTQNAVAQTDTTLSQLADSLLDQQGVIDSISENQEVVKKKSSSAIDGVIKYAAQDSIYIDLRDKKTKLYRGSSMNYQGIDLTAGEIEVDFEKQQVAARRLLDTNGQWIGVPHFDDKSQQFDSKELHYNFKTKRGLIHDVITKEDEMYVHGEVVKKMEDNVTYVKGAKFTTCDLEEPHFHVAAFRAKVIPDDKVVTGAAMLYVEGIPTPLVLPFSLFPNTRRAKSGILLPAFGETQSQGFFLRGGGYFWNINDYMTLAATGDIYSRGDYAVRGNFSYAKRYKFTGSFGMDYSKNGYGEKGTESYSSQNGYKVTWTHRQDPKATATGSSFSANVNYYNSTYSHFADNSSDYLNNQTNSSISYQTSIGSLFNFSLNASQSYNTNTKLLEMTLPTISLSMQPIYPFKRKVRVGAVKWYESINFKYSVKAMNKISGQDSAFFNENFFKNMQNGIQHDVPISSNITVLKFINWNNSATYTGRFYAKTLDRSVDTNNLIVNEMRPGFAATHEFNYSSSFSTKFYGKLQFKKLPLRAIRHVMSPSVGFSFRPDFGDPKWGYYRSYTDTAGVEHYYSIHSSSVYGGPSSGKSSNLNFGIGNKLEVKVRNKKDTITGYRKISIIDDLSIRTSYNMAADSLRWAPITISGSTRLFNLINVRYGWQFDVYEKSIETGRRINKFIWETGDKWLRKDRTSWDLSLGYTFQPKKKKKQVAPTEVDEFNPAMIPVIPFYDHTPILTKYSEFDVPWSFSFNYTLAYTDIYTINTKELLESYEKKLIQTLNFQGKVSLTQKWDIGFSSGYDLEMKKLSYTEINISRDLHCFEMSFNWVPFGDRQSWSFKIYAKSGLLRDTMKYEKNKSFRDNDSFYY